MWKSQERIHHTSMMRLGAVLFTVIKVLSWFIIRGMFTVVQQVIWFCNGISAFLRANQNPNAYQGTAHVQTIKMRFKMDNMIQPAHLNNFIAVHHSFEDPDYVLRNNVTLYTLTEDTAVFVESTPGYFATSSKHSSFFRIAQFQLAKKVITLPIHVFHQVAEKVGDPSGPLIFLTNTSRCGSTLLTQVFEETERSIAISEPDAMYAIASMQQEFADTPKQVIERLITSTVRMLCKPEEAHKDTFVIKLSQNCICLTPDLVELFPASKHLFMYRNGLKVAQSIAKLMQSLPYLEFIFVLASRRCCFPVARKITVSFGLPASDFDNISKLLCPLYCGAIVWASSVQKYLQYKRASLPMVAVRYEDMVGDPHYAMKQIFDYCSLEYQPGATDRAFSRDSQENSPISRNLLKKFKQTSFISEETTNGIDSVCDIFQVPKLYELYIAQDTITHKPKEELYSKPTVHAKPGNKANWDPNRAGSLSSLSSGYSTDTVPEEVVVV